MSGGRFSAEECMRMHRDMFGVPAACAAAGAGRVELLGNHTDYNEGFVISAAVNRYVYAAGAPSPPPSRVYAAAFGETCTFEAADVRREGNWGDYVKGVAGELKRAGAPVGDFTAVIGGDLPMGSGLSSSAALETAVAVMLKDIFPFEMERLEIARLCRRAENDFVGTDCGIMDQFSSLFGGENTVLFLDCRTEEYQCIPLHRADVHLLVCNTMQTHALVSSLYNTRRAECREAARFFRERFPAVRSLRDVTPEMLSGEGGGLAVHLRKRAEHVVGENMRVIEGREALKRGDIERFGSLMTASHDSSRDLFENSTGELDMMRDIALSAPGVKGAKLSGGGFGGCVVALASGTDPAPAADEIRARYAEAAGRVPEVVSVRMGGGSRIVSRAEQG